MKKFLILIIAVLVILALIFTYFTIEGDFYQSLVWAVLFWADAVAFIMLRGRIARQPLGQAVVAIIVLLLAIIVGAETCAVIRFACTIKEVDSFLIRQICFWAVLCGVFAFNISEWKRLGRKLS